MGGARGTTPRALNTRGVIPREGPVDPPGQAAARSVAVSDDHGARIRSLKTRESGVFEGVFVVISGLTQPENRSRTRVSKDQRL